ncbi:glycosyl transferase group 1 [Geminocystis sp. NIES-3709]|nr:glycosyl transferase group 1 [Geminocystis sp. NIES-3709]
MEGLINKASLLTVPNRADPIKFFPIDLKEARRKKKIDISDFVLIFVGQFIPRKGYKQVLEAIKLIPNIKIIFIGKGTPPQISEQIIFAGSVSHEELPQWLACANIFVLPTTGEGCSNAISEAMAMGLPIISSNLPEISCQVFPDSSILVDPMSIDEIVKGINLIKDNYDEFQSKAIKNAHSLPKEKRAEIIGKWIVEEISKEEKN